MKKQFVLLAVILIQATSNQCMERPKTAQSPYKHTRTLSLFIQSSRKNEPSNLDSSDFIVSASTSSTNSQAAGQATGIPDFAFPASTSTPSAPITAAIEETPPPSPTLFTIHAPPCSPINQGKSETTGTNMPSLNLSQTQTVPIIETNQHALNRILDIVRLGMKAPAGTYHKMIAEYEKKKAQNLKQRFYKLIYGLSSASGEKSE